MHSYKLVWNHYLIGSGSPSQQVIWFYYVVENDSHFGNPHSSILPVYESVLPLCLTFNIALTVGEDPKDKYFNG